MYRVLRALLLWVMAIALPVHGMAASMMLFCGPNHPHLAAGPMPDDAGAGSSAEHGHAHDPAAPGHEHAAPGAARAAEAVPAADGAGVASPPHAKYGCSACAACCSFVALPTRLSLPAATGRVHPLPGPVSAALPLHQPDRLERPPRSFPA